MICYIFWNMDNIKFVPEVKEEVLILQDPEEAGIHEEKKISRLQDCGIVPIQEVKVERTDSEFDLQLRMWQ